MASNVKFASPGPIQSMLLLLKLSIFTGARYKMDGFVPNVPSKLLAHFSGV